MCILDPVIFAGSTFNIISRFILCKRSQRRGFRDVTRVSHNRSGRRLFLESLTARRFLDESRHVCSTGLKSNPTSPRSPPSMRKSSSLDDAIVHGSGRLSASPWWLLERNSLLRKRRRRTAARHKSNSWPNTRKSLTAKVTKMCPELTPVLQPSRLPTIQLSTG